MNVQQAIIEQIMSQPNCKFSEKEIKSKFFQVMYYFYQIYQWLSDDAMKTSTTFLLNINLERSICMEGQSKLRKYRSHRERVISTSLYSLLMSIIQKFQRRFSVTTAAEKDKYWQYLSLAYVTEESDDPDNPNELIKHKLPWRSESK